MLADDARFADVAQRRIHRAILLPLLQAEFCQRSSAAWMMALQGKLPIAPICTLEEALNNPYVAQVGMLQSVAHPADTNFRTLANPIKVDGHRVAGRSCPPMGSDTHALLEGLGYGAEEIMQLIEKGVV